MSFPSSNFFADAMGRCSVLVIRAKRSKSDHTTNPASIIMLPGVLLFPGWQFIGGFPTPARWRTFSAFGIVALGFDWKMHIESGLACCSFSYLRGFSFPDFRRRTPGPPPFSSMNSTPAFSSACRKAASLADVTGISPSTTSTRRMVATPTFEAAARSSALHRSKARAARI